MSRIDILRTPIAGFTGIVLLVSTASPQTTVKFCELMRDPERYNGKLVKVRATWIYGYEWSYLHCLDCGDRVWLDTSALDEQSEKTLKHLPKGASIVNVDVEGVFQTSGTFGHMNSYKHQLMAHTIADPAVISKGMKPHEKELEMERKFACGGIKPL